MCFTPWSLLHSMRRISSVQDCKPKWGSKVLRTSLVVQVRIKEDKLNSVLTFATAFCYDTKVTETNVNHR